MIYIRYAQIRKMDISNGKDIGVALFVQGCHFHCKNCFNSETWDFNNGEEWTKETKEQFLDLINKPFIKRVSILGGEPLADENVNDIFELIVKIKNKYPNKKIWLYTGYTWEQIYKPLLTQTELTQTELTRQLVVTITDYLVDGKYIDELKDYKLEFRGSSNQRIIDVQKTLNSDTNTIISNKNIILY